MNKKIILLVVIFLLLIPFRLPIAVLFIDVITYIASITENLPDTILAANVVVTKIIYDIALAAMTIFNVEMLSRKIKEREPKGDNSIYWWTFLVAIFLFAYTMFDGVTTYDLYYALLN